MQQSHWVNARPIEHRKKSVICSAGAPIRTISSPNFLFPLLSIILQSLILPLLIYCSLFFFFFFVFIPPLSSAQPLQSDSRRRRLFGKRHTSWPTMIWEKHRSAAPSQPLWSARGRGGMQRWRGCTGRMRRESRPWRRPCSSTLIVTATACSLSTGPSFPWNCDACVLVKLRLTELPVFYTIDTFLYVQYMHLLIVVFPTVI